MIRNANVDFLKALAIISVITIHAYPDGNILRDLSIWAVPFFFVVAGYFYAKSSEKSGFEEVYKKNSKKILSCLLVWSAVYAAIPRDLTAGWIQYGLPRTVYWHLLTLRENVTHPINLILHGISGGHLWFLAVLLIALSVGFVGRRLLPLLIILGAAGLYSEYKPIFTGILFFSLGMILFDKKEILRPLGRIPQMPQDSFLVKCGQYSLGLYASHVLIKESVESLYLFLPHWIVYAAIVPMTFFLTVGIVTALNRFKFAQNFIR